MLATRWEPFGNVFEEMSRLRKEMGRVFGEFGGEEGTGMAAAYPPMNVWEDAENLYVEAELPGLKLEDLNLHIKEGSVLAIGGERKAPAAEKGVWYRQERGFGKFAREVRLPAPVAAPKVEARFENGVLFVTLPRAEEAKPRRIPVKS